MRAILSALAIALLALAMAPLLTIVLGAQAPGWAAWVCAHTLSGSIQHFAPSGRLGGAFRTSRNVVAVHWPHLIPIPLALATLIYMYREARIASRTGARSIAETQGLTRH